MNQEDAKNIIEVAVGALRMLPDTPPLIGLAKKSAIKELEKIKEMIFEARPPRIMVIGRRGAGKSSLINAIFDEKVASIGAVTSETGEAVWHIYRGSRGSLDLLDTRGLGDRTRPEAANFTEALDDIKKAIVTSCPDAVLFLCKAKEVDAHIREDISNISSVIDYISIIHKYRTPVVALATQVDELDPKRVEPPYENQTKQNNIKLATSTLKAALTESSVDLVKVIPVSAYTEYDNGNPTYKSHWNIDVLQEYLIEHLPRSAQLELARISAFRKVQKKVARTLIASIATICAGIAAVPIPVADIFPITAMQVGLIVGIGYIGGKQLSNETAKEFLAAMGANVGVAFGLRELARAAIKFILPGGGLAISAGIAFAGTWGIGEAAIAYFIEGKSEKDAKKAMEKARKEKKLEEEK